MIAPRSIIAAIGVVGIAVVACALAQPGLKTEFDSPGDTPAERAPLPAARFEAYDVIVDPAGRPLAAYQIEVRDANNAAKFVGIEGGEHAQFALPPYYDPLAMQHERVILAALSTAGAASLPSTAVRVARLHVMVESGRPRFETIVHTAGDADGARIEVTARVLPAATEGDPR